MSRAPSAPGNQLLAILLAELDWSPRALARRINRSYGAGTVAESAPYHWRDANRVPRPPVPTYVATVLSRELGRAVTVEELWQGRATGSPGVLTADTGMLQPWSRDGALKILGDWVASGLMDRRQFLMVAGGELAAVIAGFNPDSTERMSSVLAGRRGGEPLADQIEQSIPLLQRLDDARGGGANLAYVGSQFRAVSLVLQNGGHPAKIETRLFGSLAELGQLAGWMAFDAGDHGLAQRYFFTSLRAASAAGYQSMSAHVLADLTFQAATCERTEDALHLARVAQRASAGTPATVRASVLSRVAYGYAVAGQLADFDRMYHESHEALQQRGENEPEWMYYLTDNHLDTQAGYALSHAGSRALEQGYGGAARSLLGRGRRLLYTGAHDAPLEDETQQRRAMFEGAWLAVAAAGRGDLEQACIEGDRAVQRTATVSSSRSMSVLQMLKLRLSHRHQNEYVADFLPTLDAALVGSPR